MSRKRANRKRRLRVRRKARKQLTAISVSFSLHWDRALSRYVVDAGSFPLSFRIDQPGCQFCQAGLKFDRSESPLRDDLPLPLATVSPEISAA